MVDFQNTIKAILISTRKRGYMSYLNKKDFKKFLDDFFNVLDSGQLKLRVCDYTGYNANGDVAGLETVEIVARSFDEYFDAKRRGYASSNYAARNIWHKKFVNAELDNQTYTLVINQPSISTLGEHQKIEEEV
tara:strand:+ start:1220 stop:1618 length:399 start_codon:yes stop_codon:yes gene_type:complete